MTGEKILNYKMENLTEENQFFRSFVATHTQFSKKVIVKTLKPLADNEEKNAFIEEIRKLAHIQHPNVITLYDHLETANEFYLVFEYLEGNTLADYIRNTSGPIPEAKTKALFVKVLDAFSLAHQKGVMNGAINAGNIIITKDKEEEIKVLDLALSSFFNQKSMALGDKEVMAPLSPEHIQGEHTDHTADIYSLGVLLFQMLTGKAPYDNFNMAEIKHKIVHDELPPIKNFYPVVSDSIQAVVNKATAKKPADRYQSCEEFKKAVLSVQENSKPEVLENQKVKVDPIENQDIIEEGEVSVYNLPPIVLGTLLTILLILTVYYGFRKDQTSSEIKPETVDEARITHFQDSMARAMEKKALEDSIRVLGLGKRINASEIYIHKAERGENLQKIAQKYYNSLDSLKILNNMTGKERLKPKDGVKVRIRAIHIMQRGETIFQVGQLYGVDPNILIQLNTLYAKPSETPDELPKAPVYEGKEVIIPIIAKK